MSDQPQEICEKQDANAQRSIPFWILGVAAVVAAYAVFMLQRMNIFVIQ